MLMDMRDKNMRSRMCRGHSWALEVLEVLGRSAQASVTSAGPVTSLGLPAASGREGHLATRNPLQKVLCDAARDQRPEPLLECTLSAQEELPKATDS